MNNKPETQFTAEWTAKDISLFSKVYKSVSSTKRHSSNKALLEALAKYPILFTKFSNLRDSSIGKKIKVGLGKVAIRNCPSCGAICTSGKIHCSRACNNKVNASAKSNKALSKRKYIAKILSKTKSTNEYTKTWTAEDCALFTKVAGFTKTGKTNQYELLKALEPHRALLKKFLSINAYGREDKIRVALGDIQIPICPTCDLPSKVTRVYCSNRCATESPNTKKARQLKVRSKRKNKAELIAKYIPSQPTTEWDLKHTKLFRKIWKIVCKNYKSTKNGRQYFLLKALEKKPKLLSRYLGIPGLSKNKLKVALGNKSLSFCASCNKPAPVGNRYCSDACMYSNKDRKIRQVAGMKETWHVLHGVDNMSKIPHVKKRMQEKYGTEYYYQSGNFRRKRARSNLERYGDSKYFNTADFSEKRKSGMLRKYGVEHPMQSIEIFEKTQKSQFKLKQYTLVNRNVEVQGYEGLAIDYVLSKGIKPENIRVGFKGRVPSFKYDHPYKKARQSIYHPDFMVLHKGRKIIVEVKSEYTLLKNTTVLKINRAKAKAVIAKDFKYKLLVMTATGKKLDLPENWLDLSRLELRAILRKQK